MIRNLAQLVENTEDEEIQRLRHDACVILTSALRAVDPENAVNNALNLENNMLLFSDTVIDLSTISRIFIVGGGKAGALMVKAVESILGDRITDGIVNVLKGTEKHVETNHVELNGASHPLPCSEGEKGVKKMLNMTNDLKKTDLVITLISGGGSSLMPHPASGITLSDLQDTTEYLLTSGANINELNTVRKHLSNFKGGQFARHTSPALMLNLILSDVVGDPLSVIASGPTVPDPSTFTDVHNILQKYELIDRVPENVFSRVNMGMNGIINETPKTGDPLFESVHNIVIANIFKAAKKAQETAHNLGYNSMILSTYMEGDARTVGQVITAIAKEEHNHNSPLPKPAAIILGGETTVVVRGNGIGGRNQELALAAVKGMSGLKAVLVTLGTDGIDGPTDAAGAIVDGKTHTIANQQELIIEDYLANNDSYHFFKKIGDLIFTGPTGTNVNDFTIILTR